MLRNLGPRRFGEHKEHDKMAEVVEANLREGDILIAKEWSNNAADVAFVRTTQAVFSHVSGGSSQSEHVLLNCRDGGAYTVESVSQGINITNIVRQRDHVVYSCGDDALRREASNVGKALAGIKNIFVPGTGASNAPEIIEELKMRAYDNHYTADGAVVKYKSMPGMAASVFRRKALGKSGNGRLELLHDRVYGDKPMQGIRMMCSEFAASCYEVAALEIEKTTGLNPMPFGAGVDPRAMTAKALESVLGRSNTCFNLAGRFNGSKPLGASELSIVQTVHKVYTEALAELGGNSPVADVYKHIKTTMPTM